MYAKFCVNRETASNFMRLFVNRRAYAIQAERPLPQGPALRSISASRAWLECGSPASIPILPHHRLQN